MNIKFIKTPEKRKIIEKLKEQFGVSELPYLLFETGKEKIRVFSGSLSKEEIMKLSGLIRIEIMGLYLIRKENDYRLSFDATQLLSKQITKNMVDINNEQYELWMRGHDLEIQAVKGTIAIRYNKDFIGCGKSTGEKIINHIPKERRLKTALIKGI